MRARWVIGGLLSLGGTLAAPYAGSGGSSEGRGAVGMTLRPDDGEARSVVVRDAEVVQESAIQLHEVDLIVELKGEPAILAKARVGEALAARRQEIDLAAAEPRRWRRSSASARCDGSRDLGRTFRVRQVRSGHR